MALDLAAADHICNVIRRRVLEEFPNLTVIFIAYGDNHTARYLAQKKLEIKAHPAGHIIMPVLEHAAEQTPRPQGFFGLSIEKEKRFLPFMAKDKTLACGFVNAAAFEDAEDLLQYAYRQLWHALKLQVDYKQRNESAYALSSGVIVQAAQSSPAFDNLVGDSFAAFCIEWQNHKNYTDTLAHKLCQKALSAIPHYRPELFPYPMAMDVVKILMQEMNYRKPSEGPLSHAYRLAEEVAQSFDQSIIRQWQAFTLGAQDMAWSGASKNKIIGAAVYTSEDPYMRSIAYLVSEMLNIEPIMPANFEFYNAFTDQEANERHHKRLCEETFFVLTTKTLSEGSYQFLEAEIRNQNNRLLQGDMMGWCAHGLLQVKRTFKSSEKLNEETVQAAKDSFHRALNDTPWLLIRDLSRALNQQRALGKVLDKNSVASLAKKEDAFAIFLDSFHASH